jgi:hypothetical protein
MVDYRIDSAQKLIFVTGGYATPAEWTALLERLIADPERRPGFGYLRDLRTVTAEVDVATVRAVVAVFRRMWAQLEISRVALVTGSVLSAAAVAQVLGTEQEMPVRAFTDYAAAVDWVQDGQWAAL